MLRLNRQRHQSKTGDKIDFQFSSFKALQVPKGWDKLVVSFVSVESGKTVAKTTKALVRNGSCQWIETISESIRLSDDDSSKEIENCLFKLIISMGLARSSILGEATVNLTEYMSTGDFVPVSLTLKKCTHGTTLQMKIQCMTPRLKSRDEDSKPIENYQEIDTKSDGTGSDSAVARSQRSSSSKDFSLNSNPGELGSRETSFSLSESRQSYDSAEGSLGGEDMSANSVSPGTHTGSEIFYLKNGSSFNSQSAGSSLTSTGLARNFQGASEEIVNELRAEAQMWERNARKLMLDLDALKVDFSDLSKAQERLSLELSEATVERDLLKREVGGLKLSSNDSQTSSDDLAREELRFRKEENADLALQLKRSHESNIELVSVLHELEETVERQRKETEDLIRSKSGDTNLSESEESLKGKVGLLERALEEKNQLIEKGKILNSLTFLDVEDEHKSRLLDKDRISFLRANLSENVKAICCGSDAKLVRDIENLKEKVKELERDCNELTEENLELLFKLKESKNEARRMSTSVEFPERTSFEFQLSEQQYPTDFSEESLEKKVVGETKRDDQVSEAKLAEKSYGMEKLLVNLRSKEEEISVLRQCQSELEAEVSDLRQEKTQIQKQMEVVLQESEITSKSLNDLQNDLEVLLNSVDAQRKSSELETGNQELELRVTELEQENAQFSVLVASLEGQLRDLAIQLDSSQLELENSKSYSMSLSGEVDRLRNEMRSTVKSFVVECDSLRKSSGELSSENMGLRGRCSILVAKLEESHKSFADSSKKVDELEQYLSSVVAEFESKEKSLSSEIDLLIDENLMHKEKVTKIQKLEQEVENLMTRLSETHEEIQRLTSDSEAELKRVSSEVVASHQEHEKLLNLVESYKSCEAELKATISDLELKLTVSGYQRQQLSEDSSYLKVELKKFENLENELGETRVEKEKLEGFVCAMTEECQDLKMEKSELIEKVKLLKTKHLQMEDDQIEQEQQRARKASKTKTKVNPVQNDKGKSANQRRENRRTLSQRENGSGGFESPNGSPCDNRADLGSKIHSLEDQLVKALEKNNKYKAQLDKLDVLGKSTSEGEVVSKAKHEHTKSILEAELREIRERYSTMSLKYAEVESQREELVMKLKSSSKNSRRWFS